MTRPQMSKPEAATRRLVVVHLALCLAFAVAVIAAVAVLDRAEDPAVRWLVAAVPLAVLAAWAWALVKLVRVADEMIQQLQLRAAAIAGAAIVLLLTGWGTLDQMMPVPHFPLFLTGPAFAATYGLVLMALNPKP